MPVAWTLTLVVVAFSAFAVRDTVFPTLGHSATPSVWEPTPEATVPRYTEAGLPGAAEVPGADTRPTVLVVDLPDGSSTSMAEQPVEPRSGEFVVGPPYRGGSGTGSPSASTPSSSSTPSGGTATPSPSTSSPSPSTTSVTGSSTPSSTTDPSTTDSIGGGQNGKGSGSGGGGTDDDHP